MINKTILTIVSALLSLSLFFSCQPLAENSNIYDPGNEENYIGDDPQYDPINGSYFEYVAGEGFVALNQTGVFAIKLDVGIPVASTINRALFSFYFDNIGAANQATSELFFIVSRYDFIDQKEYIMFDSRQDLFTPSSAGGNFYSTEFQNINGSVSESDQIFIYVGFDIDGPVNDNIKVTFDNVIIENEFGNTFSLSPSLFDTQWYFYEDDHDWTTEGAIPSYGPGGGGGEGSWSFNNSFISPSDGEIYKGAYIIDPDSGNYVLSKTINALHGDPLDSLEVTMYVDGYLMDNSTLYAAVIAPDESVFDSGSTFLSSSTYTSGIFNSINISFDNAATLAVNTEYEIVFWLSNDYSPGDTEGAQALVDVIRLLAGAGGIYDDYPDNFNNYTSLDPWSVLDEAPTIPGSGTGGGANSGAFEYNTSFGGWDLAGLEMAEQQWLKIPYSPGGIGFNTMVFNYLHGFTEDFDILVAVVDETANETLYYSEFNPQDDVQVGANDGFGMNKLDDPGGGNYSIYFGLSNFSALSIPESSEFSLYGLDIYGSSGAFTTSFDFWTANEDAVALDSGPGGIPAEFRFDNSSGNWEIQNYEAGNYFISKKFDIGGLPQTVDTIKIDIEASGPENFNATQDGISVAVYKISDGTEVFASPKYTLFSLGLGTGGYWSSYDENDDFVGAGSDFNLQANESYVVVMNFYTSQATSATSLKLVDVSLRNSTIPIPVANSTGGGTSLDSAKWDFSVGTPKSDYGFQRGFRK